MPKIRLICMLLLLSGTSVVQAVIFTDSTLIDSGDATYDGQDIVVNGCTLTVNGVHNFNSLLVINAGVVTHSAATDGNPSYRINLTVAQDVVIAPGCKISADGKGHGSGSGPGAGSAGDYGGGAGYGGSGGAAKRGGTGGTTYGSITEPDALGSGGGNASQEGGSGGGIIRLTVGGTLAVEGSLTANGSSVSYAGAGSGGSIYVTTGVLAGGGIISANGGNSSYNYGGGGGGGRIAVYCNVNTFSGTVSAYGGSGFEDGAAGTIFTKLTDQALGDLLINNGGRSATKAALTPLISPDTFDEVTIADQAQLDLSVPDVPTVNKLTIANEGFVYLQTRMSTIANLHVMSGGTLSHHAGQTGFDLIVSGDVVIESGGSISADGKGHGSGSGPGAGSAGDYGGGAGYGGSGGAAKRGGTGGTTYGSITEPDALGSGGGNASQEGGSGGGIIRLTVGGTLAVEGSLTANGSSVSYAGAGSGGSIYVTTGVLAGGGIISANGGNSSYNYGGGGGGGRVAVYYKHVSSIDLSRITADGGSGYESGQPGSVHLFGPNAPLSISHASIAPMAIDISENEATTFEYAVNMDAQVTIKIYKLDTNPDPYYWQPFNITRAPTPVATPAKGISAVSGLNSFGWDGKDDLGVPLASGAYAYTIEAQASDGRKASYDPEYTPQTADLRNMTVSENFNPYRNEYCEISYDLHAPAWLDLHVFVDAQSVRRLVQWQPRTTTGNLEIWDGRNASGSVVGTSSFNVRGYAQRLPENAIIIQSRALSVSSLSTEAYLIVPSYNQISTVHYQISRDAKVTIKIYDANGSHFRTLVATPDFQAAGSYAVEWDGTNDEGELASIEGDYRVEVALEDASGNTVIRNANIVVYR